jgi:DNA-binding MarR family transcriptional regulator
MRVFLRLSETVARDHELTPQRYLLLLMIKGAPDGSETATVSELADRLQLSQSTVTELIARSESAGLVERAGAPGDARITVVRVTDEGERRVTEAMSALGPERRRLTRVLASLERAT